MDIFLLLEKTMNFVFFDLLFLVIYFFKVISLREIKQWRNSRIELIKRSYYLKKRIFNNHFSVFTMLQVRVLFIFFISFSLSLKATPTIREKYADNYLKLVELIFDNHNIDIMNRDFYEGYSMNFKDKCNAELKLKTYSYLLNIFKVNICTNQSEIRVERI